MKSFLSIIIPCYNVEGYLPHTIDSLKHLQNASDVEFIFINDGSLDNSFSLIDTFAKEDNRVVVINQPNQGVSAARNNAIAIAEGEYLLCLDGDDYLEPDTVDLLRDNCANCDALLSPLYIVSHNSKKKIKFNFPDSSYSPETLFDTIKFFPPSPMLVYRTDIIHQNHLQFNKAIKSGEVLDFTFSFFEHCDTVKVISSAFYNYVMRSDSATHQPNIQSDLTCLLLLQHSEPFKGAWAKTYSYKYTLYKVINSFTYNKYLHSHLSSDTAYKAISVLLTHAEYGNILKYLVHSKNTPAKDKLLIRYQLTMPYKFGFQLMNLFNRIFHHI